MHPRADISPASNQQRIKNQNATLLFDLVRRLSPISRAALTKTSGLSAATVTALVDELLQGGWLVELGAEASGARGRRPINLAVNAARGAVATLEIISDGFILSVYDIGLRRLTLLRSDIPAVAANIQDAVITAVESMTGLKVAAVNVDICGICNPKN